MKRKKNTKLVLSDIKILDTINELNKMNRFPSSLGVYKILSGSTEVKYLEYKDLNTYNTLTSQSPKRISRQIVKLVNLQLVMKLFRIDNEDPYFQITEQGSSVLINYYKNTKNPKFKKKIVTEKQEIIEIE